MARVLTKRSTVSGHEPTASDLEVGEIAVNTADSRLFTKHSDGVVKNLTQGQLCSISLQTIGVEYKDADEVYINPGAVYIVGPSSEGLYYLQAQTALLFSGLSVSTWYAVYVVQPASGNTLASTDFTWSSTMPTRNFTKQGWYHPSNTTWRCIGFVRTNASAQILQFSSTNREVRFNTYFFDANAITPNTTWTDVTITIPIGGMSAILRVAGTYSNGGATYAVRTNGATDGGIEIMYVDSACKYGNGWVTIATDSSKVIEVRWLTSASANPVYVLTYGFVLPDWIQTGASGGSETVSPVAVDWATTTRGLQSISIEYKDADEIYLNPGSIHIWGSSVESVYQLPAQISKQLTGLSANTWYAIYIAQPTGATIGASDVTYSSTMPTRNLAKMGWYDSTGTKRCIGFVFAVATNTLISFIVSDNTWRCDDGVLSTDYNATIPNTSYTNITLNVPVGNVEAWVRFIALYSSGAGEQYCHLKVGGTGPISVNTVGSIGVDFPRTDLNVSFPVNSSKQVAIRASNTATSTLVLQTYGFVYPEHIYTGPAGGTERSIQTSFDLSKRGAKTGLKLSYKDADEFYVDGGVIHVNDGSNDLILEATSQLTKSVTGLSATTWYAIYVDPPDTGTTLAATDIEYSSTMPTYDHAKAGWYHPTNTDWRCIGVLRAGGSSEIVAFQVEDGIWRGINGYLNPLYNATRTTTDAVTITAGVPSCARQALVNWVVLTDNNWNVLDMKAADQIYNNYYGFVHSVSANRTYGIDLVPLSAAGQFTAAFENAYSTILAIYLMGYAIPAGM